MSPMHAAPVPASRFRMSILGAFALERDAVPIATDRWQRRVSSLLKLLATAHDHRRRRDDVIEALWPDTTQERGDGNLRILTHRLRVALGAGDPSPVVSDRGWLTLHPAYAWEIDLEQFEELARAAPDDIVSLEAALAIYRGEPLVEERYEDWAMPIRERAHQLWRGVCLRLSDRHQGMGATEEAIAVVQPVLGADPLDEAALRSLLAALLQSGSQVEALRRYREFEQRLWNEIGVWPLAETRNIVNQLYARSAAVATIGVTSVTWSDQPKSLGERELYRPPEVGVRPSSPHSALWWTTTGGRGYSVTVPAT